MAKITKQYLDFNGLNLYNEYVFSKIKQSDWTVNDPSDPRYVHGRTHWVEEALIELMPEQTVVFEDGGDGGAFADSPVSISLEEGKEYVVTWDGVRYKCTCAVGQRVGDNVILFIGNSAWATVGEDTGEPFLYMTYPAGNMYRWGVNNTEAEHTIGVSVVDGEVVHPIDKKFLPESVKVQPDLSVNDENDPRYVENRTHWVETIENPERTMLLPETVYSNPVYGRFLIETTEQLINNFKNGSTYIVTLNGVEYECVAHSGGIGNSSLQTGQEDTDSNNEPFWCQIDGGIADEWVLAVDSSQGYSGTIQIEALAPRMIVHYLDAQYLINSNVRNGEGDYSIAEGYHTVATGDYGSHAEGEDTTASGNRSHAEGYNTSASGESSHAEGEDTTASGNHSHAEGSQTAASGGDSHAEGWNTTASGNDSHAEGSRTKASENAAHAEGSDTTASGRSSHAEGEYTCAFGRSSHAEGRANTSYIYLTGEAGSNTYVLSNSATITAGDYVYCSQYDSYAIVENYDPSTKTITLSNTLSSDDALNKTSTNWMHGGIAYGEYSHIEGLGTKANSDCQHVQGKYNIADTENKYAHIVGNGDSTGVTDTRSNAHTIDWEGNAWFAGKIYAGGTGQDDTNAVEVATLANSEEWVFTLEDGSTVTKKVVLG